MYYVPDGTKKCGYYECGSCHSRFLSLRMEPRIPCPYCEKDMDMELGPDESMEETADTAVLLQTVEGEEVEKLDKLLCLAVTGGDYEWL